MVQPTLATGEFAKSEQQQTKFTKRTRKTSRPTAGLPKTLTQKATTRAKQVATITETLQTGDTSEVPTATVDIESESLGDGTFVVRKTKVPSVFNAKTEAVAKPDVIPPRFTAKLPTKTVTETKEAKSVTTPTLGPNDYRKEEERISEFEVRTATVTRDGTHPSLSGTELEEAYNVQIPYTETIGNSSNVTGSAEVEPLSADQYLVRTYDPAQLSAVLTKFDVSYPTRISLDLPRVLTNISVKFTKSESFSDFNNLNALLGKFKSVTQSDTGSLMVSGTITPEFVLKYKDVWGNNIPATNRIFFLKEPVTKAAILGKLQAKDWPVFKPRGAIITATSKTLTKRLSAAVSRGLTADPSPGGAQYSQSDSIDEVKDDRQVIVTIPPCLTAGQSIQANERINLQKDFLITYPQLTVSGGGISIPKVEVKKTLKLSLENKVAETLPGTSPADLPSSGTYLTDCRVEFFKYGWFVVQATVFDASALA